MSKIVDIYTEAVYDNLRPLRANWAPDRPVSLGDFGIMEDEFFVHLGNVGGQGIEIGNPIAEKVGDQKIFSSDANTTVSFTAKGTVGAAGGAASVSAKVAIDFSSKDSAFFNAADCSYSMIADKAKLAKEVMALFKQGQWKREWVVVTDIVRSGSTTIVISGAKSASIVLEAEPQIEQINLADAQLVLSVKSASNVGYQLIAQKGLAPLIGLAKIQSQFLWFGNGFRPLSTDLSRNFRLRRALENAPEVATEPDEYLSFSQLA